MCLVRHRLLIGAVCLLSLGLLFGASVSDATDKDATDKNENTQAMLLEIYFKVSNERAEEFEKTYAESYIPALRKQQGYLRSNLLRVFLEKAAREIGASPTEFNYQMELVFDTEENRRKWVASKEHATVWPLASGMAEKFAWRGFDVVGKDRKAD